MPEIWVPYGQVETLLTIQAENLGTVVEPAEGKGNDEMGRAIDKARLSATVFVCDVKPPTIQILKELAAAAGGGTGPRVVAPNARKLEALVPELRGRVSQKSQGPQPMKSEHDDPSFSEELMAEGSKVFVATASPDPLFGLIDAKVAASLNWIRNARRASAQKARSVVPSPFVRTDAYAAAEELVGRIPQANFVTAVPRHGKVWSVFEDAPFDVVCNGFSSVTLSQSRAMVVGIGGSGYDDTFSSALRILWGAVSGLRKSGEVLLFAECSGGLGSRALEMLVEGRISEESARRAATGAGSGREKYVDGIEELAYLDRLKTNYDVLLLSGLPEVYSRSKLGLGSARGSAEALGKLLNKLGRSTKVNVVTRASEVRIASS